jgi:2-oxoisovalerate dehydrogenase E1 component
MSHLPGIRVVYPSFADDACGLLRTAIRSEGPTFFLEPKYLYNRPEAQAPICGLDFAIPFGKGRLRKSGEDLSVITYGNTVYKCLNVAHDLAKDGHNIEVFDIRSIKPLDRDGICTSVKKTGKVLIVHEDHAFNGIGGEIASVIAENCFTYLDAPIKRLSAKDIPIGFAKVLENAILPQEEGIKTAALYLLSY